MGLIKSRSSREAPLKLGALPVNLLFETEAFEQNSDNKQKRRSSKVIKDERRESVISQAAGGDIPPNGSNDAKSFQPAAVSAAKQTKQNKDSPKPNRKDLKFSAKKESSLVSPQFNDSMQRFGFFILIFTLCGA